MILAEDAKTDLSQVATSHLIRLIIIITVFPFIVNSFYDVDSVNISEKVISNQNLYHLIILIISSVILILFFEKIKSSSCFINRNFSSKWFIANHRSCKLSNIS